MLTAENLSRVFEDAPKIDNKYCTGGNDYGFVGITPLGLPGFNGCPPKSYGGLTKGRSLFLRIAYAPITKRNISMTFTITDSGLPFSRK